MAVMQPNSLILVWLVVLPFFVAGCAALFPRLSIRFHSEAEKEAMAWAPFSLGALASLMGVGLTVSLLSPVLSGAPVVVDYWWTRDLYHLRFQADRLSLLATLAIYGIGFLLHLHVVGLREAGKATTEEAATAPDASAAHRAATLLAAQGCGAAAALSADLISLVFFLQLMLVALWLFVSVSFRERNLRLLAVAQVTGLLTLGGALLMWQRAGDTSAQSLPLLLLSAEPPTLKLTTALVLLGLLPLLPGAPGHGWLASLRSEKASAAMMPAALVVIVGAALALRLLPGSLMLPGVPVFAGLSLTLGLFSLWWGALRAWLARDLRGVAVWLTVAQSGYLLVALAEAASPTAPATVLQAAALQMVAAPLGLAAVWTAVSYVSARAGTDALPGLSGLFKVMPLAGVTLLAGGLSVAGLPPLVGFHVQRLLVLGLIGDGRWPLAVAMICVDLLLVTAVVGAFRQSFLRAEPAPRLRPASGWLSLQLSLSVAALVALGVFPGPLARWAAALFSTALGVSP